MTEDGLVRIDGKQPGTLSFELHAVALGPHYPAAAIAAEIGRVAIAAARVDDGYARLLEGLHGGQREQWQLEELRRRSSQRLRDAALARVDELFTGDLLDSARTVIYGAYAALDRRHIVMHSIWTLSGPDAFTAVDDLMTALVAPEPAAALEQLTGRDIDSSSWHAEHPRTGKPGPASVADLLVIRRELEAACSALSDLTASLASALYAGKPAGARRILDPGNG